MPVVTMKQLLEAGVHFGHQTRRWNPRMRRFIFGERNGIYILDLAQTLERIDVAYRFVRQTVEDGGSILFVGTKKQAQEPVQRHASRVGMPYINYRWLGGMLTNFQTVSSRVKKLNELEQLMKSSEYEAMPKKEALMVQREAEKLERNLGGIRSLEKLPSAIFVIDTKKEHIAVTEANRLGIPVVAVVDTNCDPDIVDFAIPGNDDAIRAATLMCRVIADACDEGRYIAQRKGGRPGTKAADVSHLPPLDPEAVAKKAQEQKKAKAEAAAAAKEREARVSESKKSKAEASSEEAVEETEANPDPAEKGDDDDKVEANA